MSEAPVLTKKQQRLSLSARKKRTKEVIRNVFTTPYKKYWPCASEEQSKTICHLLRQALPKTHPGQKKVSWDILKNVPRSERKSFRQTQRESLKNKKEDDTTFREGLIFGVNEVTKGLEKLIVKSVLISKDVLPKLMVEHVIDQCVLLEIPVLVVQGLKTVLTNTYGFSSIAMAFTIADKYREIQQTIKSIQEYYPVPENHINRNRTMSLFNVGDTAGRNNDNEECSIINISDFDTDSPSKTGQTIKDTINQSRSVNLFNVGDMAGRNNDNEECSVINISDFDTDSPSKTGQTIKDTINQSRSVNLFNVDKTAGRNNHNEEGVIINISDSDTDCRSKTDQIFRDMYLYRESKSSRAFVPPTISENPGIQMDMSGLLSFAIPKINRKKNYKSLTVNRVKGNANRNKNKIEVIKKRKKKSKKTTVQ